jgi:hypothetical protein
MNTVTIRTSGPLNVVHARLRHVYTLEQQDAGHWTLARHGGPLVARLHGGQRYAVTPSMDAHECWLTTAPDGRSLGMFSAGRDAYDVAVRTAEGLELEQGADAPLDRAS